MDLVGGICTVLAGCRKISEVPPSQRMASETIHPGCSLQQTWDLHHQLEPGKRQASFQVTSINSISVSHIDLGPVKGFTGGPDVGLVSGCVPTFWATARGWVNDTVPSPLLLIPAWNWLRNCWNIKFPFDEGSLGQLQGVGPMGMKGLFQVCLWISGKSEKLGPLLPLSACLNN